MYFTGKCPVESVYIFTGTPTIYVPANTILLLSPVLMIDVSSVYSSSIGFLYRIFLLLGICVLFMWPHY